jgi:hypothetical protein
MQGYKTSIPDDIHAALKLLGYTFEIETDHVLASIEKDDRIRAVYGPSSHTWVIYDHDYVVANLLLSKGEIIEYSEL